MTIIIGGNRENQNNIQGLSFQFKVGEHIKYQNKLWMIVKLENNDGQPAYLLDLLEDNTTFIDNVLESEIEHCDMRCATCFEFIEQQWAKFVYNGNNSQALNWTMKNIIKKLNKVNNVHLFHNQDNTLYTLEINHSDSENYTWTKEKTI